MSDGACCVDEAWERVVVMYTPLDTLGAIARQTYQVPAWQCRACGACYARDDTVDAPPKPCACRDRATG